MVCATIFSRQEKYVYIFGAHFITNAQNQQHPDPYVYSSPRISRPVDAQNEALIAAAPSRPDRHHRRRLRLQAISSITRRVVRTSQLNSATIRSAVARRNRSVDERISSLISAPESLCCSHGLNAVLIHSQPYKHSARNVSDTTPQCKENWQMVGYVD